MRVCFAALAFAMLAGLANATTFDLVADYDTGVFTYGTNRLSYVNNGAAAFGAFTTTHASGCFFGPDFACHNDGSDVSFVPMVGHNSGADYNVATFTVPNDVLFMHPATAVSGEPIVRFTAPSAGTYAINGAYFRLEDNPGGSGVLTFIFQSGLPNGFKFLQTLPDGAYGSSISFSFTTTLAAGDTLDFGSDVTGTGTFVATGLAGTIITTDDVPDVPEPSSWAMLLAGAGMILHRWRGRQRTLR